VKRRIVSGPKVGILRTPQADRRCCLSSRVYNVGYTQRMLCNINGVRVTQATRPRLRFKTALWRTFHLYR